MPDSDPSLHRDQSGSSQIFAYTALALDGAFLSGVASAAYPLQPADPHWLLGVIHALVDLGVLPLVGICLLLISGRRYPDSDLIWNWLIRSRRLAGPVCLGFLLLLPLQLATTGWALLGPEQAVISNLNLLGSLQREMQQHPDLLPSRRDLRRLLAEPGAAPTAAAKAEASPAAGGEARGGVQTRTNPEPAISSLDRRRILASIDTALTNRAAGLRQRLLRGLQEQIPPMLRNLLQALLLLMAYSGVAMNDPNRGSLLQQLQLSWFRARNDLVSSNRQRQEDSAELRRQREQRELREAVRILRQAGEDPAIHLRRRRRDDSSPPVSSPAAGGADNPAEPES